MLMYGLIFKAIVDNWNKLDFYYESPFRNENVYKRNNIYF